MYNECHTIVTLGARVPEIFHDTWFQPAVDSEPFSRTREKNPVVPRIQNSLRWKMTCTKLNFYVSDVYGPRFFTYS